MGPRTATHFAKREQACRSREFQTRCPPGEHVTISEQPLEPAMSPALSIDREALAAFCRLHHIRRLALFGSAVSDDFGAENHIDILVEFEAGHVPGLKFVTMERELSQLFNGRRVDLVTPKFLNPRIRDQVLGSAESLYVAA